LQEYKLSSQNENSAKRAKDRKVKKGERRQFKDFITRVKHYENQKEANLATAITKAAQIEMQRSPF
jgi:hypothetical protein